MSKHPLSRPLSGLRRWRVSAPPPLLVTIAVDCCLFVSAGLLALIDAPAWSYLVPLAMVLPVLIVYGRKAAEALGIRSRDETPRGRLITGLGMLGGLVGVLAAHEGRYAGLVVATYIALAHIGERITWARFRAIQIATKSSSAPPSVL
jgi:hypothetical protein